MNRVCWWAIEFLSGTLEPGEREFVRGDLAESGETGRQALVDVLGLILRRQAALWKHWRPWLVLTGLVVPLGMLLNLDARRTADGSAIYLWLYIDNWTSSYITTSAFRSDLFHFAQSILMSYLYLVCWSWLTGFALSYNSRVAVPVMGMLFGLMLFCGNLVGGAHSARDFPNHAGIFAVTFYRVVFPQIVLLVLVLIPAICGVRMGLAALTFGFKEKHI